MGRQLSKQFNWWPNDAEAVRGEEMIRLYEQGFAGAWGDDEEDAALADEVISHGGYAHAEDAAHANGWADSMAGKLVVPFVGVVKQYPGAWPGPNQIGGSCVSHSTKNACLLTLVCEVLSGRPDEVTGIIEGLPVVSETAIRNGVLSTESNYWWRRHGGHGWQCSASARVVLNESGCCWPRADYPQFGVNVETVNNSAQMKWGARTPPAEVKSFGMQHAMRTATVADTFEEVRDLLGNGYGLTTCGSEGFARTRDANGVSRRSGSWSHAMAYIGADDREETKRQYGEPLVLILNSWGRWNSGPRKILGTDIEIPEGAFWARWSEIRRRSAIALSHTAGWPAQKLPDWGGGIFS